MTTRPPSKQDLRIPTSHEDLVREVPERYRRHSDVLPGDNQDVTKWLERVGAAFVRATLPPVLPAHQQVFGVGGHAILEPLESRTATGFRDVDESWCDAPSLMGARTRYGRKRAEGAWAALGAIDGKVTSPLQREARYGNRPAHRPEQEARDPDALHVLFMEALAARWDEIDEVRRFRGRARSKRKRHRAISKVLIQDLFRRGVNTRELLQLFGPDSGDPTGGFQEREIQRVTKPLRKVTVKSESNSEREKDVKLSEVKEVVDEAREEIISTMIALHGHPADEAEQILSEGPMDSSTYKP